MTPYTSKEMTKEKAKNLVAEGRLKEAAEKYAAIVRREGRIWYEDAKMFKKIGKPAVPVVANLLLSRRQGLRSDALDVLFSLEPDPAALEPLVKLMRTGKSIKLVRPEYPEEEINPLEHPREYIDKKIDNAYNSAHIRRVFQFMEKKRAFLDSLKAAEVLARFPEGAAVLKADLESQDEQTREVAAHGLNEPWSEYSALCAIRRTYFSGRHSGSSLWYSGSSLSELKERENYIVSHTYSSKDHFPRGGGGENFVMGDLKREVELQKIAEAKIRAAHGDGQRYYAAGDPVCGLDPRAFPGLVKILTCEWLEPFSDRAQAGRLIVKIGLPPGYRSHEDVRKLREFLTRGGRVNTELRRYAVFALFLLGEKDVIDRMGKAELCGELSGGDVINTLGRMGKDAYPLLMRLLEWNEAEKSIDWFPKYLDFKGIVEAIVQTGDTRFIPELEKRTGKYKGVFSGDIVGDALRALKSKGGGS